VADGTALQAKGIAAGTAATGEADQYAAQRIFLRSFGVQIGDAPKVDYNGIQIVPGPAVVLKPDFACCPGELKTKFPTPEKVKISPRSTLVVRGSDVTIESLDLDGCLVIDVDRGETALVKDLVVKNEGWVQTPVRDSDDEVIRMRGFKIERKDQKYIEIKADPNLPKEAAEKAVDDDTSVVNEDAAYEVEDSFCGVNFGASKKPGDGSECSICTIL